MCASLLAHGAIDQPNLRKVAALLAGSVVIFLCAKTQALELRKSEHRSRPQPCRTQTLFRGMKTHRCAKQRTESLGQCYRTAQPAAAPKSRELEALSQFTASNELHQPKKVRAHNLFDLAVRSSKERRSLICFSRKGLLGF